MEEVRLLALCGSLRESSKNRRALLRARDAAPPGCVVRLWDDLAKIPPFSPDLDQEGRILPDDVESLEAAIGRADGLLLACPEYAHGVPGAFKNALDWMVGSVVFPGKPVAVWNIAPHTFHAQQQLREILRTMSARIIENASLEALPPPPGQSDSEDAFDHKLRRKLCEFRGAILAGRTSRALGPP